MVSVVMATYNGEKHLIEQLDSIRNQRRKADEVIIRDDCSIDDTAKIIKKYIHDNRLEEWNFRVNKTNKGFFNNFIDAIKETKGDTIYLADQDDIWDLNKIDFIENIFLKDNSITMVQSDIKFIDEFGNSLESNELYHGKKKRDELLELTVEDICKFAGSGFTMCFRRSVLDKIISKNLFLKRNIFMFHDILLGQMAIAMGKVYLCPYVIDFHRLHSNNVTKQVGKSFLEDRTKKKQLEILRKRQQALRIMGTVSTECYKEKYFKRAALFAKIRYECIRKFSLKKCIFLIFNINMYATKKGIVTDFMYSIGLEKLLLKLYKNIK